MQLCRLSPFCELARQERDGRVGCHATDAALLSLCRLPSERRVAWWRRLGLDGASLTPGAAQLTTLAGTLTGFEQAAEKTLVTMSGIRLSESTVERTTEGTGRRLRQLLAEVTFGEAQPWDWQRDASGRTCGYVSLDATGIRMQGERAGKADGRMAYVGMLFNPRQKGETSVLDQRRYLADFYNLTQLGRELHRQATQVAWQQADVQIALSDGGAGLEDFVQTYFPRAICILDFWHAAEHLANLARAIVPPDDFETTLGQWCQVMKHEGGRTLLAKLEAIELQGRSAEACETFRKETNYLRNNVHRMDYHQYVSQGWRIGSGPIEAACKTIVNQRLNCSGMRWSETGADSLCALRALYLSDSQQWNAFWHAHPN